MKYVPLLLTLLLPGCATFPSLYTGQDPLQQVDRYLNQQEYSKALSIIAATPETSPQATALAKKRKTIVKELKNFEHQTVSTALKLERKNDWPGAKDTYKKAIRKLNHSAILEKEQEAMLTRFQSRMRALEHETLIVTGEWLKKILPLQRSLHDYAPGNISNEWSYSSTKTEAEETALELLQAGKEELTANNLAMAQRLLSLAAALNPTPETKAAAEQLKKQLGERNKKRKQNRKKAQQKKNTQISDAFNKAMAHGNLIEAREQLARLPSSARKQPSFELMQERLNQAITTQVEEELAMGESFYRAGEYKQALTIWQNILKLVPEHTTVQLKIERAERVIAKLNALQEQQKPTDK